MNHNKSQSAIEHEITNQTFKHANAHVNVREGHSSARDIDLRIHIIVTFEFNSTYNKHSCFIERNKERNDESN